MRTACKLRPISSYGNETGITRKAKVIEYDLFGIPQKKYKIIDNAGGVVLRPAFQPLTLLQHGPIKRRKHAHPRNPFGLAFAPSQQACVLNDLNFNEASDT